MERFQRIVVCIDRPDRDGALLTYSRAIARLSRSTDIQVLHVSSEASAVNEGLLQDLVDKYFSEAGLPECRLRVIAGAPLIEILKCALDEDVDLIVIGRHYGESSESTGDAALARRIAQKSTCSVLVIPEHVERKAKRILVPVRDSECSCNALETACSVAAANGATVTALNVFQVHAGYSRVGTTHDQHLAILAEAAERECAELITRTQTHGVAVESQCAPDSVDKPVNVVLNVLDSESSDLVVIGARGRSGAAGVLLGRVTEHLIQQSPVPVLAVKKKGECVGVLRALLTLAGQDH